MLQFYKYVLFVVVTDDIFKEFDHQ